MNHPNSQVNARPKSAVVAADAKQPIDPKPSETSGKSVPPTATAIPEKPIPTNSPASSTPASKDATPQPSANAKPPETKPADAKPVEPTEFVFRTIRVEDPKLVEELEAAGVRFEGVRPSFLSNLMMSWILPIGLMFLLWTFLARRLGSAGGAR